MMFKFASEPHKEIPPIWEEYFSSLFWHIQSQITDKARSLNLIKFLLLVDMTRGKQVPNSEESQSFKK